MFDELNIHHRSLRNTVLDLAGRKKSLETVDFGVKFKAKTLLHHKSCTNYLDVIKIITALQQRCFNVLKKSANHVSTRLPEDMSIFKKLSKLHPSVVLKKDELPNFADLPFLRSASSGFELLKDQYRKLIFVDWTEETYTNCINGSSGDFSLAVYQKPNLKQLAEFALTCLSVPISNAIVERIFLLVTAVKTNV